MKYQDVFEAWGFWGNFGLIEANDPKKILLFQKQCRYTRRGGYAFTSVHLFVGQWDYTKKKND